MKRYTSIPFPAYRHRPGTTPHPERDPRGHSHRSADLATDSPGPPSAHALGDDDLYLYGVDLFNAGYWWEAHEAWERLWKLAPREGPEALFLQGLIQLAAARLKLELREPKGAARLGERSLEKFRELVRIARGRRVRGLDLEELAGFAEAVVECGSGGGEAEIVLSPRA